jgi:hypothetical protein
MAHSLRSLVEHYFRTLEERTKAFYNNLRNSLQTLS